MFDKLKEFHNKIKHIGFNKYLDIIESIQWFLGIMFISFYPNIGVIAFYIILLLFICPSYMLCTYFKEIQQHFQWKNPYTDLFGTLGISIFFGYFYFYKSMVKKFNSFLT